MIVPVTAQRNRAIPELFITLELLIGTVWPTSGVERAGAVGGLTSAFGSRRHRHL